MNLKSIKDLLSIEAAADLYNKVKAKRDKWLSQIAKLLLKVNSAESTLSALAIEAPSSSPLETAVDIPLETAIEKAMQYEAPDYRGTQIIGDKRFKELPRKPLLATSRDKVKHLAQTKIGAHIVPILLKSEIPMSSDDLIKTLATQGIAVTKSNMSNFTTVYCQRGYLKQLRYTKQSKQYRGESYWVLPNYPKSSWETLGFEEWGKQLTKRK